jgi:hypothetical protein
MPRPRHFATLVAAVLLTLCLGLDAAAQSAAGASATQTVEPSRAERHADTSETWDQVARRHRDDRTRLAEAFRLAAAVGDDLWPGWSSAPFAVLLVAGEREYLLRHPRPSADFTRIGYDSLLGTEVYGRPRVFAPGLLATFPAVGGVPTIVVGTPAATRKSSTEWVLTLLHEHFHQLQTSRPGYYAGVEALGLARGDQTGMWMLNYAFPYDTATVKTRVGAYMKALEAAITSGTARSRAARWPAVARARAALRDALAADDDRYLAFQMWQEGVARYTELAVARRAAKDHVPSESFRALPDFTSYADEAAALERSIEAELRRDVGETRRVAFYAMGAATALLLDDVSPDWRARYFARGYSLDSLLTR